MQVKETVIRLMTRLAIEHDAVNLSQGFTDEAPAFDMVWGAIAATLGGTPEGEESLAALSVGDAIAQLDSPRPQNHLDLPLRALLEALQNPRDQFNQYSFPFGMPELRHAIAGYTETFLGFRPDEHDEITVVLGASEGMAVAFRAICEPGDAVVVMQPFHEIYPAQLQIFGLEPRYLTLREDMSSASWQLDLAELEAVASDPKVKAIIFNSPHNPTGKVFTDEELSAVAKVCVKHDLVAITDEIYEHMVFDGKSHLTLRSFDGMAERTILVNSISKTGRATGWRVGWVVAPAPFTRQIRAIHDNLAVQAPSPLQKGAVRLLKLPRSFFEGIADPYARKREQLMKGLGAVGFRTTPPEGAYYLFSDYSGVPALKGLSPTDAAMYLIKEIGVASVPGDNFYRVGNYGDRYLRFAFCRGMETIEEGIRRLSTLSTG